MKKPIDYNGQRYGMLIVVCEIETEGRYRKHLCQCDCGQTKVIFTHSLTSGNTRSCGCLLKRDKVNITGKKFGRLTVLKEVEPIMRPVGRSRRYLCKCECGNTKICLQYRLRNGGVKSCGCLVGTIVTENRLKHGHSQNGGSRTYKTWSGMIQRCMNPDNDGFEYYGKRGITVCESWLEFKNFLDDMGARPKGTSLDRIDNSKGYSPDNCKWSTHKEQMNNTRSTLTVLIGKTQISIKRYSEAIGMAHSKFYRLHKTRGLSIREIMAQEKLFYQCAG